MDIFIINFNNYRFFSTILQKQKCKTHNLFAGEVEQPGPQDGGREEPQEYEARHDGVAHLRVGGEVARRALPQRVEQAAHGGRALRVRRRDGREHLRRARA